MPFELPYDIQALNIFKIPQKNQLTLIVLIVLCALLWKWIGDDRMGK